MDGLVAVIFALCANASHAPSSLSTDREDYMVQCFDYYTNCTVGKAGKVDPKDVKKCKDNAPKEFQ